MSEQRFCVERILQAYIDGAMSRTQMLRLRRTLREDVEIRQRIDELRFTRNLVRKAFRGVVAPGRDLPAAAHRPRPTPIISLFTSVALATGSFSIGWLGRAAYEHSPGQVIQSEGHRKLTDDRQPR